MRLPAELQGRFEVHHVLGRGGMGVVLAARDRELNRDVALKLLHSARNERTLERFRREGELTARLRHPGIVTLHSAGNTAGVPFLAYELVPGARTLEDVQPELSRERRLELVRDVARALGHAHEQGIVHRDLKPANVLIDSEGHVKVADFGLAAAGDMERLTVTGAMLGTPGFMAPEQFRALKEGLSPRTDVWALGVLLYWCLTDDYPFEGSSLFELERKVLATRPRLPRDVDPAIGPGVEAVCLKALATAPQDRYADGAAFADELDACLSGERPSALLPSRPKLLPFGLGLFLAIAVGAGAGLAFKGAGDDAATSLPPPADPVQVVQVEPSPSPLPPARNAAALVRDLSATSADPEVRLNAAWRLLRGHPRHPERERALEVATRLGRERPLWTVRHGGRVKGDAQGTYAWFHGEELLGLARNEVRRWNIPPEHEVGPWPEKVRRLAFSALGPVTLDPDGRLTLREGGLRLPFKERAGAFHMASAQGASWVVLTVGRRVDGLTAVAIDLRTRTAHDLAPARLPVWRSAVSSKGERAVLLHGSLPEAGLSAGEGLLRLWDLTGPAPRLLAERPENWRLETAAFAADGRFVVGTGSGHLLLFDAVGEPLGSLESPDGAAGFMKALAHSGHVRSLAFSPSGQLLYSAGKGNRGRGHELRCWDLPSRTELWGHATRPHLVSSLAVSQDGAYLAVGSNAGEVEVWLVEPERL